MRRRRRPPRRRGLRFLFCVCSSVCLSDSSRTIDATRTFYAHRRIDGVGVAFTPPPRHRRGAVRRAISGGHRVPNKNGRRSQTVDDDAAPFSPFLASSRNRYPRPDN